MATNRQRTKFLLILAAIVNVDSASQPSADDINYTKDHVSVIIKKPLLQHLGIEPVYGIKGERMTLNELIDQILKCEDPSETCDRRYFQLMVDAYPFAVKNRALKYIALLAKCGANLLLHRWLFDDVYKVLKRTMEQIDKTVQKEVLERIEIITLYKRAVEEADEQEKLAKLLKPMYHHFFNCIVPVFPTVKATDELTPYQFDTELYKSILTDDVNRFVLFNVEEYLSFIDVRNLYNTFRYVAMLARREYKLYGLVKSRHADRSATIENVALKHPVLE